MGGTERAAPDFEGALEKLAGLLVHAPLRQHQGQPRHAVGDRRIVGGQHRPLNLQRLAVARFRPLVLGARAQRLAHVVEALRDSRIPVAQQAAARG